LGESARYGEGMKCKGAPFGRSFATLRIRSGQAQRAPLRLERTGVQFLQSQYRTQLGSDAHAEGRHRLNQWLGVRSSSMWRATLHEKRPRAPYQNTAIKPMPNTHESVMAIVTAKITLRRNISRLASL
jgi:hypothetical protein